jgi:ribonuclease R
MWATSAWPHRPIRRYPDLIVHRQLKHLLHQDGLAAGGPPPQVSTRKDLAQMAADSSSNERRAMEVEREVIDLYRAFLMRDRVGEVLDGTIAGVAPFGLFVQIEVPFVEGLVRTETLADGKRGEHWELDETGTRLSGRNTGRTFTLGDTVKVRVENVSVQRRKVDLVLEDHVPLYRGYHARYDSKDEARRRRSGRGDGGGPPRKGRARGR